MRLLSHSLEPGVASGGLEMRDPDAVAAAATDTYQIRAIAPYRDTHCKC